MAAKRYGTVPSSEQNKMSGLAFVKGLADGSQPLNTMAEVLDYDVVEAEVGRVVITAAPTGAKSNMWNGSPSARCRKVATTTLGGVPISVSMPPRIVAKESGISVAAGLRLAFAAACMSTGMSRASAATLFITADRAAATVDMIPM